MGQGGGWGWGRVLQALLSFNSLELHNLGGGKMAAAAPETTHVGQNAKYPFLQWSLKCRNTIPRRPLEEMPTQAIHDQKCVAEGQGVGPAVKAMLGMPVFHESAWVQVPTPLLGPSSC